MRFEFQVDTIYVLASPPKTLVQYIWHLGRFGSHTKLPTMQMY